MTGAPVEGLTGSLIALLHHGLLGAPERRALLDALASPHYRTAWGIRSTPNDSPLYDPDAYARGSVWALGTAEAITAAAENPEGARLVGVEPKKIGTWIFAIATATTAFGGAALSFLYQFTPDSQDTWIGLTLSVVILGE